MGRYERLKTEIESGNGAQPLSESRYERLKKEMGESSSVSSAKTKKTKKPAPSSLDNRPKSETNMKKMGKSKAEMKDFLERQTASDLSDNGYKNLIQNYGL